MNQLHLQYKKETGKQAVESHNAKILSNEIIRVDSSFIPDEYISDYGCEAYLDLPTPEYIKWLEDKISNTH